MFVLFEGCRFPFQSVQSNRLFMTSPTVPVRSSNENQWLCRSRPVELMEPAEPAATTDGSSLKGSAEQFEQQQQLQWLNLVSHQWLGPSDTNKTSRTGGFAGLSVCFQAAYCSSQMKLKCSRGQSSPREEGSGGCGV